MLLRFHRFKLGQHTAKKFDKFKLQFIQIVQLNPNPQIQIFQLLISISKTPIRSPNRRPRNSLLSKFQAAPHQTTKSKTRIFLKNPHKPSPQTPPNFHSPLKTPKNTTHTSLPPLTPTSPLSLGTSLSHLAWPTPSHPAQRYPPHRRPSHSHY